MAGNAIVLFTDFGPAGPYTGQMESVLRQATPKTPIIHLLSNAPAANPLLSAYLLAALCLSFSENSIFLCVVDPGVGGVRRPVVLKAGGHYFVGPDNGLLNTVAVQAGQASWWLIDWQPENCSMSFHGRDVFAPVAARLATGTACPYLKPISDVDLTAWPEDLDQIIYFDVYGNAMTGIRYRPELQGGILQVGALLIAQADTFSEVAQGKAFWYRNSSGLVEIAVNRGSAERDLNLKLGAEVSWKR